MTYSVLIFRLVSLLLKIIFNEFKLFFYSLMFFNSSITYEISYYKSSITSLILPENITIISNVRVFYSLRVEIRFFYEYHFKELIRCLLNEKEPYND